MMMMVVMMMMVRKRLAQVPKLCVPIYNMKLAMMQKTLIFTTFSAHTKMAADKRGQIEVFARNITPSSVWSLLISDGFCRKTCHLPLTDRTQKPI